MTRWLTTTSLEDDPHPAPLLPLLLDCQPREEPRRLSPRTGSRGGAKTKRAARGSHGLGGLGLIQWRRGGGARRKRRRWEEVAAARRGGGGRVGARVSSRPPPLRPLWPAP